MNNKIKMHREFFCLMKDSITGLAAMQEDTSDKLIEAVENTSQASKVVEDDLVCRFQELEKVVARMSQVKKDATPKLSIKKDIFRIGTLDAWEALKNCQTDGSSDNVVQFVGSSDSNETCAREKRISLKRKCSNQL